MPRRKQMVPKKHGDQTTSSAESSSDVSIVSECESKEGGPPTNQTIEMNDEILDLSIKKKKSEPIQLSVPAMSKSQGFQKTSPSIFHPNPPMIPTYHPNYSLLPHPFFPYSMPAPASQVHFLRNLSADSSLQNSAATTTASQSSSSQVDNTLSKLNNLVSKVGKETLQKHPTSVMNEAATRSANAAATNGGLNFHELWYRFVKKEENAEVKRINEAKQIFTCLQCQASFQTMDLLVKHMETTRHFANIPKHYSWSLQYARQKMRQMKMKMKYSDKMMYFCFLCQTPFTEPVHVHFNCVHDMHNPVENMKHVHIISMGMEKTNRSSKKKWSRSSSTSTNGSEGSSPSTPRKGNVSIDSVLADSATSKRSSFKISQPRESISSTVSLNTVDVEDTNSFLLKMEEMVDSAKVKRNMFEKCSNNK